jgi:hypothetical protein
MATVHYELLIKGNQDLLCAYLQGFLRAKKIRQGVIFAQDCPLQTHLVRELLEYHRGVTHLICRAGLRANLVSAINGAPEDYSFEIKKERKISSAFFSFEFETVSRKVAGNIKRAFTLLPAGLKLRQYKPQEKIDPEAVGLERYAPAYDYRFWGTGRVTGDVELLLNFHAKLSKNEFISLESITLRY